ncbi:Disease resistance protein RPP8 [Rhynchospora pubera]|uniref:Disease resistance protein RPP8 n=1 Tax=Rhynchospora pubera TaxID=906938 RepID=A0AAV8DMV0_9POAL|nr:Disease resistance protein RPP8 [Rhynchospora pubera]
MAARLLRSPCLIKRLKIYKQNKKIKKMAEAIVSFVVGKLGDLIIKEAGLLGGVKSQVKRVQTELMNIRCYLASADSKQRKGDAESALVENWLNQLRDVAYRLEDVIDIFYVELEGSYLQVQNTHNQQKNYPNYFLGKLKNLFHKSMKVPGLHKLGIELADIQKELEDIFISKDKYGLTPLLDQAGRGPEPVIDENKLSKRRPAYQDLDETEIVGLDADRDNILKLLLSSQETPRRDVITIVGTGGLGKTTLAHMVYKRAKPYFEYHTILTVSQQFSLNDLLAKMLGEVVDLIKMPQVADPEKQKVLELISKYEGFELKKQDFAFFISKLKILLSGIKYLIIFDDVWEVKLWDRMQYAMPDYKNGSRVLMTSRSIDVARLANPKTKPYELTFLNDKESCDLLLKKACYYKSPIEVEFSSDLLELANELSKKCKGLPLALIVLGGILSTRHQNYHDWKKVLDTMDWHQEGRDCMNVLAMSYEDMPYYLKPCFIYLASFPEDYEISARNLIYMWVAEGFIPEQGKKTLEETAEIFLEQLYERSMVQVSSRYCNGSIKYFRVHDLLHDLAMHEARKVNFVTVFQKLPQSSHADRVTRRVSIQANESVEDSSEFMKYIGSNTRSLLLFDRRLIDPRSAIDFRLLRVLETDTGLTSKNVPQGFDGLIHLKYLGIKNNDVPFNLPRDFCWDRLKNLETLIGNVEQQMGLWSIRTLRHVKSKYVPFDGPPANADLRNLQTLQWMSSSCLKAWHKNQLPILNNLRKLGLHIEHEIESVECEMVDYLLATLPYLLSLKITGGQFEIPKEIVYPRGLPNYQNLETLLLVGRWPDNVTVEASLFPPHLISLTLGGSQLAVDPMPELGKLKSLKKFMLEYGVYIGGKEMVCPAGFPALQTLGLYVGNKIKNFTVMEGVMPKLKHLDLDAFFMGIGKLNLPPELQHLALRDY